MRYGAYPTLLAMVLLASGFVVLPGCGEKLTPEQKSVLAVAALASKERAVSFDAVASGGMVLAPNGEVTQDQIDRYIKAHARGLNAQAASLNDLVKAVNDGSGLSQRSREALREEALTAESRYENFVAMSKHISGTPAVNQYLDVHREALQAQAVALAKLAASFPSKNVKEPRAEVVDPDAK
jgi:hypothetical protein